MDTEYHENLIQELVQYLPNYQRSIKYLRKGGYEIIGYARKPPSKEELDTRIRLLQMMINNLADRSLATSVYVSVSCSASDAFDTRDLRMDRTILEKLEDVSGSTQVDAENIRSERWNTKYIADLLEYLHAKNRDICLASIDFAGLTTNCVDLKNLFESCPHIKKIAIITYNYNNEVHLFDAQDLLSNSLLLQIRVPGETHTTITII